MGGARAKERIHVLNVSETPLLDLLSTDGKGIRKRRNKLTIYLWTIEVEADYTKGISNHFDYDVAALIAAMDSPGDRGHGPEINSGIFFPLL